MTKVGWQYWICLVLAVISVSKVMYGQADQWNQLTAQLNQLVSSGRAADAIPVGKQAVDLAKKTFGTSHVNYAMSLNNLGWAYALTGNYSEAEPLYRKSMSICEKLQSPELARPLSNLASMYAAQHKFVEAESSASQALDVTSKSYGADSANTASAKSALAFIYATAGNPNEAERLFKDALATDQRILPSNNVELGRAYGNLGFLYQNEGKKTEAGDCYQKALEIFDMTLSPQDPLVLSTRQYIEQLSATQSGMSSAALFQQCMNEKIQACMYDCTRNYGFKESRCRNELCSTTKSKSADTNNRLWIPYCQRKVERELRN